MNENEYEKKNEVGRVKTFAEDMASTLESGTEGLVKKVIHGEEKHEAERKNLSPESTKNELFMIIGFLLILAALITVVFFLPTPNTSTVPVEKQFTPLIFNDRVSLIAVDGLGKEKIPQKILHELSLLSLKDGGVGGGYLTINKSPVGLRKFLEITEAKFVPGDARLVDENFLLGVIKNEKNELPKPDRDFFLLMKINSLADVFDSIHAWESKMFADLYGFLGITLSPETGYLLTKDFEDGIIENKNARILYSSNGDLRGEVVMMYVMVDDSYIIITSSEKAVEEIIRRLASGKIKK